MRNDLANSLKVSIALISVFLALMFAFPQFQDWRAIRFCKARPACVVEINRMMKGCK